MICCGAGCARLPRNSTVGLTSAYWSGVVQSILPGLLVALLGSVPACALPAPLCGCSQIRSAWISQQCTLETPWAAATFFQVEKLEAGGAVKYRSSPRGTYSNWLEESRHFPGRKWWRQTSAMDYSESEGTCSDEERFFSGSSDEYSCDEAKKISESVLASNAF